MAPGDIIVVSAGVVVFAQACLIFWLNNLRSQKSSEILELTIQREQLFNDLRISHQSTFELLKNPPALHADWYGHSYWLCPNALVNTFVARASEDTAAIAAACKEESSN